MSSVGCRAVSGHHIADVVHHFLSDGDTACLRAEPAAEAGRAPARFFVVAAAGRNPTAAVAAAGLATGIVPKLRRSIRRPEANDRRSAAGPEAGAGQSVAPADGRTAVFLRESPGQRWSAFNYLCEYGGDVSRPVGKSPRSGSPQGGCAGLGGRLVGAGRVTAEWGLDRPPAVVNWLNLGPLGAARLANLEAASNWHAESGCPVIGRDGLVWCLLPHEIGSFRCAYALGRLVAACRPRRVVLLVFADCWANAGAAATGGSAVASDPTAVARSAAWLRRCTTLAKAALPRVPVTAAYLGSGPGHGNEVDRAVAARFGRVARSLLAPSRA